MSAGSPSGPWYALVRPWGSKGPGRLVIEPEQSLGPDFPSPHLQGRDMTGKTFVGIDVSKDRLDVHVRPGGMCFAVSRDAAGLEELVARLAPLPPALVVGALLSRWSFLLELDYVHATRYGHETSGGEMQWRACPQIDLTNRTVLVVDDIYDVGKTLLEIVDWCRAKGACSVKTCVFVEKLHDRKANAAYHPDFVGAEVGDKYLFGCGMDYKGFFRNLMGVYALQPTQL